MVRNVSRWAGGLRFCEVERRDLSLTAGCELATGGTLDRAWRRAKYAVLDVCGDRPGHLVFHCRMTGQLVRSAKTMRLVMHFPGGVQVGFTDVRRLGDVWWIEAGALDAFFAARNLGPEPWPEVRDGAWWAERLRGLRGALKPALMRQNRVAGLGNIAGSEVCWLAGISPKRPVPELSAADYDALAMAVPAFIERTLAAEDGQEIQFVQHGGEGSFSVYGRAGEPCPRCGQAIERIVQSGRATFYCVGSRELHSSGQT